MFAMNTASEEEPLPPSPLPPSSNEDIGIDAGVRAIIEEAVDAFFQGDSRGRVIRVNELSCVLTGYAREELLSMTLADLFTAEELARAPLRFDLLKAGKMLTMERNVRRKDGSLVPVEMRSRQMSDGSYQSIVRDLTERKRAEASVRRSEARLRRAEIASHSGNWELHLDTQVVHASEGAARIYGVEPTLVTYAGIKAFPLPEYRVRLGVALQHLIAGTAPYALDFRIRRHNDGQVRNIHSIAEYDPESRVVFGVIQDVTERRQAEARMQLAASVLTHAREGILITDVDGQIVEVNDTFTQITGYTRDEVIGRNPRMFGSGEETPAFYAELWRTLRGAGHWSGEIRNRRKNGDVYPQLLTISVVRDSVGNATNYLALFTDITTIREHQKQLEHVANHDVLTNLPNRALLTDRLYQAINLSQRQQRSLAVVYLDLDGFKQLNDRHGHDVGDEFLTLLAQRMKEQLRDGDTLARFGGDEFIAVLGDLEAAHDCEPVISRLLAVASTPLTIREVELRVSASIGVTIYPNDGADADQLIRHADQAMFLAKQSGKNCYHLFDVDQDAAVKTLRTTLDEIERAITEQELVLHYQPKVNMRSGQVIGAEALIRWQHPERGLLLPKAFLPTIDGHPISIAIGEWVINKALDQMVAWDAQGLHLPVSINVGARQLQQNGFADRLQAFLEARPSLAASRLQIEILESSALEDIAQISQIMLACCKFGVQFAIDDFGTGYSSLTYLRRLPAELLKIDQSFVRDMLVDPDDLAIVQGVIGLASAFRRRVIAEGVETVAHGEKLLKLGCELAQGYGIARPMPSEDLPAWVRDWQPDPSWLDGDAA